MEIHPLVWEAKRWVYVHCARALQLAHLGIRLSLLGLLLFELCQFFGVLRFILLGILLLRVPACNPPPSAQSLKHDCSSKEGSNSHQRCVLRDGQLPRD